MSLQLPAIVLTLFIILSLKKVCELPLLTQESQQKNKGEISVKSFSETKTGMGGKVSYDHGTEVNSWQISVKYPSKKLS